MRQLLLILLLLFSFLKANEYALVVAKETPIETVNTHLIKAIFLKKKRFINNLEIIPINLPSSQPLRKIFEEKILGMERDRINEYWIKQHYKGNKPPKVQRSIQGVKAYIQNIPGAMSYMKKTDLDNTVKSIYEF